MALSDLQKRQLNEKQLTYVVWRGTPAGLRSPATETEFCALFDIGKTTVWRWKQDPRVLDAIRLVTLQHAGNPDNVSDILQMVFNKAVLNGDLKAAELWLKSVGVSNAFTRDNSILDALEDTDFADYSDEELERLKNEALAGAQEDERISAARKMLDVELIG
jgi:hypothetical protein